MPMSFSIVYAEHFMLTQVSAHCSSMRLCRAFAEAAKQAAPEEAKQPTMEELIKENQELKSRNLFLIADVENARRRFARLAQELEDAAVTELAKQILPVCDNIKRIEQTGDKQDVPALLEAVRMIDQQFHSVFKGFKIERMSSKGTKFNPEFQDAVAQIDTKKKEDSGVVIDVITEGYTLAGKVLRAAKVVVGK